jgi:hypothetical protein
MFELQFCPDFVGKYYSVYLALPFEYYLLSIADAFAPSSFSFCFVLILFYGVCLFEVLCWGCKPNTS